MYYEHAKLTNGSVTEYPVTVESMDAALEAGLSATNAEAEELSQYNLVSVTHATQAIPQDGYNYVPTTPTLVEGVWVAEKIKDENTPEDLIAVRELNLAPAIKKDRDTRIKTVMWRVERYERNSRLGLAQVDNIAVLDAYIQALADVPSQASFPFNIVWPTLS